MAGGALGAQGVACFVTAVHGPLVFTNGQKRSLRAEHASFVQGGRKSAQPHAACKKALLLLRAYVVCPFPSDNMPMNQPLPTGAVLQSWPRAVLKVRWLC